MGTLAEEAAGWRDRGDRYGFRRRRLIRWSDFWTKEGGRNQRFKWGELNNGFGLGLQVVQHDERWLLNVCLVWPGIWINLGDAKHRDYDERCGYGFKLFGASIHARWGKRTKIINGPWKPVHVRREYWHADGEWRAEPRLRFWKGMPEAKRNENWEAQSKAREYEKAERWQIVEPWTYQSRTCDGQEGTALIHVERRTWRQWWLQWTPLFQKQRTSIDVTFSREVGNRAGSWKGGTIGCGYTMRPGESPQECFRRMMHERSFDR